MDLTYASDTSEFIKTSEQTPSGRDARVTIGVTLAPVQECGFPGCLVFLSWSERSSKETEPKKHNAVRIKFRTRFAAGRFYEKFVADTFYEKSLLQTFYEKSLLQTHSMKKGLATNPCHSVTNPSYYPTDNTINTLSVQSRTQPEPGSPSDIANTSKLNNTILE